MADKTHIYPTNIEHLFPKALRQSWHTDYERKIFSKGELLSFPGNRPSHIFYLVTGTVRIFHLHLEGKECLLGMLEAGDMIDLFTLFSKGESTLFARALSQVEVIILPKQELQGVITTTPSLAMQLLDHFSCRLQETITVLEQLAYDKVEERLHFLFQKLALFDQQVNNWIPLPTYLTHKDFAGMIGSTRETITFIVNKWLQDHTVKQEKGQLFIHSHK